MTPEEHEAFHKAVTEGALEAIDLVERGEAPFSMDEFKELVAENYELLMQRLHLLRHAGLDDHDAMVAIAMATACELKAQGHQDAEPDEVLATLWLVTEQHKLLFMDEYLEEMFSTEGDPYA